MMATLLFSSPDFNKHSTFYPTQAIFEVLHKQIENPLKQQEYDPKSHFSKRTFRLFMPVLARLFGINEPCLLFVQYAFGILFFFVLAKLSFLYTEDKAITFLFVVGFCGIYVGKSFFLDYWAFFDGTAFFFLLLALYFKNPVLLFLCLFAAYWTDERAIVASWGVFVFHLSVSPLLETQEKPFSIVNVQTLSWISSLFLYSVLRLFLAYSFCLKIGIDGIGLIWAVQHYYKFIPLALFMFLESYWVWIALGICYLVSQRNRKLLLICFLLCIGLVAQIVVALSVGDMVRSGAYLLVPCITCFILVALLAPNKKKIKEIAIIVFFLAFLIPTVSNFGKRLIWMKSDYLYFKIRN